MSPDLAQHIQAQLTVALAYLFEAVVPFLMLQSPLYWPFLVSALVVGGLFWRFGRRRLPRTINAHRNYPPR